MADTSANVAGSHTRDIIVIGASLGGLDALSRLVQALPGDLAAAVFVVLHMRAGFKSELPEILSRRGPLKAAFAVHGESIERGRIYVAPVDNQLMVRPGYTHVIRGPKENGNRPSVDALFRSAANAYGSRVIGVVLTGTLDCGTAGLLSIKARDGLAIVQDPAEARAKEMPQSAIRHVGVDHIVPVAEMPALLTKLVSTPASSRRGHVAHNISQIEGAELGVPVEVVCPHCQGSLTMSETNHFQLFRCHVGHAFSLQSMAAEQADAVERALWAASRSLEEGAALAKRLAKHATGDLAARFSDKAETQHEQALVIRQFLLGRDNLTTTDAAAVAESESPIEERSNQSS